MEILGKEINVKDYDCSFNPNLYEYRKPVFNLYVQTENRCNAKCDFCNYGKICSNFDYDKLNYILEHLFKEQIIKRISLTGGEPLLNTEKLLEIIKISNRYNLPIVLNSNGFDILKLQEIYDFVDEIYISKHHYNNDINDSIMQLETPTIEELSKIDTHNKICINCVLQKGYIDSFKEIISFLEFLGTTSINKIKFISPYPLTKEAINKNIDAKRILNQCSRFTNAGILYNKEICQCLEFLYVCKTGKVITVNIKYNKTNCMECCQQLVYNGENLFSGFKKKEIIL